MSEEIRYDVEMNAITALFLQSTMEIKAMVLDNSLSCLVDTGANVSCLSEELWKKLEQNKNCPKLNKTPVSCGKVANASELLFLGRVQLELCLVGKMVPHPFYIARNLNHDCILGSDFLTCHQGVVDYKQQTLTIEEDATNVEDNAFNAYSLEKIRVAEHGESIFWVD